MSHQFIKPLQQWCNDANFREAVNSKGTIALNLPIDKDVKSIHIKNVQANMGVGM